MLALTTGEALRFERCVTCGGPLGFEFTYCCDGRECGCMGLPVDPPVCSSICYDIAFKDLDHSTCSSLEANVF